MSSKISYSYTVLRYVHDVATGEFINVGVLLYAPSTMRVEARTRKTITRIKGVFPNLDRTAFTEAMRSIDRAARDYARELKRRPLFTRPDDVTIVARAILPADDSSLQWSSPGVGITEDPEKAVDRLYERLVERYDSRSEHRRSDDEVWRPVREQLRARNLEDVLREKTIVGPVDEIHFKHAWKNGQWHVYEPLSLDLADAEGIKDKARRWLGNLSSVAGAAEQFRPHFLVGAPQQRSLKTAYKTALAILRQAPIQAEIFEEGQVDDLVASIEDEVRASEASRRPRS